MTTLHAPRVRGSRTQDDIAHVGRLRVLQLVVVAVLAGLVVLVTLLSARELLTAQRGQTREGALQAELIRFRDDARLLQVKFWRTQAEAPGTLPSSTTLDLLALSGRARGLAARERELDPGGEGARVGERVAARLESLVALARDYLTSDAAGKAAIIDRATRGPVPAAARDADLWTRIGVARADARSEAQAARIRELALRVAVLVSLLIGAGVVGYVLLGRARSRLVADLAELAAEQAALRRVATAVAETHALDRVFAVIAEELASLLGARSAMVVRCERDAGRVVAHHPAAGETPAPVAIAPSTPAGMAVRSGRAERLEADGEAVLACPVAVGGRAWGVVLAVGPAPAIRPGAEAALVPFARLAAVAVADADARDQLAERASTDPLTRLPNHGAFQDRLAEEVARARAAGTPLALVVLDLDHFKSVNDGYGHQVGDRVLAEVAGRLRSLCRDGEMLARVGGEEFAWILPDTDLDGGMAAARRGREAVSTRPFPEVGHLTLSAGVCDLEAAGTAAELFRLADAALLAAKRGGRNRAVAYDGAATPSAPPPPRVRGERRIRTFDALRALARAVDARDAGTAEHSRRVAELSHRLAVELGWTPDRARLLREAAVVHDVGRIGVPDSVLRNPGPLTDDEMVHVHLHPVLGARIVAEVLSPEQAGWVRHHHERIDGGGYPDGLAGDAIPEGARILAVADAWDAITTPRAHRPARTPGEAYEEFGRIAGTQLDPAVVAALARLRSAASPSAATPGPAGILDPNGGDPGSVAPAGPAGN